MQRSRSCLLLKKLASDKICEITMNGSSVSKCFSMLRIGSSHNCMLMFNSSMCSRNHVTERPIPNLRYCSSDLKFRGLRSLEKYIDVRQGEILTAEMFESKMLAAKTPSRIKKSIFTVKKEYADLPAETQLQSRNRNPRNMELLGYNKPRGYGTLYKKRDFWNRLNLLISNNHITAFVEHHTGKILVCASTKEFSIARHLWRTNDVSAAINIGRVIAQRCKETGIERVFWWMKSEKKKERAQEFMRTVKEEGLRLTEPRRIVLPHSFISDDADFKLKKKKIKRFTAAIKRKHTYF